MLGILIGLIVGIVSFWGLMVWWQDFLVVFRGLMPISFLAGGIIAIIAGIAGWHEAKKK